MDNGPPFEAEFHSESSVDGHDPPNDRYTGPFFPGAQNFVIAGGEFKSTTKITHVTPPVPFDFRMIPMGDLDLRYELSLSGSGVVNRWHRGKSVRRVYSARIHGSNSKMTVAVYQGENAEEEWREDISRNSWLRHPNFVQLYATASSFGVHATIFHDDLVPATQILAEYHCSHLSTVYLYNYLETEFYDVHHYMGSVYGTYLHASECMMWIRRSTGRLCADLARPESDHLFLYTVGFSLPHSIASSTSEPPEDSQIIESTPLDVHHEICSRHLRYPRYLPISSDSSVQLGAIIACTAGNGIENSTMIADIPENMFHDHGWSGTYEEPLVTEDGWARISSSEFGGGYLIDRHIFSDALSRQSWLAQANYIFNRLGIASNYDDFVFVDYIQYQLMLSDTGRIPPGYLFLCPLRDLQSNIPSHFRLPECPAYWSLDPSGAERLSTEEADDLRFPRLELKMVVWGRFWDDSLYTGIRQFHEGKGYNPCSQDVTRELGLPLFQLSSELESLQETESCSGDDDSGRLLTNEGDGEPGENSLLPDGIHPLLDGAELLEPSGTWKITMAIQFILMLASSVFCLISYFPLQPTSLDT